MTDNWLAPAVGKDVVVEGVRFRVHRAEPRSTAAGPPVLLLHGVPETSAMWRYLLPDLARDRVALAVDLKGLGNSEARGPYDIRTVTRELVALIRGEVDGEIDVVGHDWGGVIGIAMATLHPGLVRRLVMINAPYRQIDYLRAWHIPLFSAPALPELLLRLGGRNAVELMLRHVWRSERPLDQEVAEHYKDAYASPERTAAMLAYYRAATRPRLRRAVERFLAGGAAPREAETLSDGPQRALVVWGAADPVLPVSVGEAVVRDLGPRTEMVTVPGAGHFVVEESPEVVVTTIGDFLRRDGLRPNSN
ncbi:MAG: alpha/beta fold hydrolase [Streptosporangiales bacterium]|nr:alpha/beta fold hydrolase [Streptosporangiales bacterium]